MICDRCQRCIEKSASSFGPPWTNLCEHCTVAKMGSAMVLLCGKPSNGGWCRERMGHDGPCDGLTREQLLRIENAEEVVRAGLVGIDCNSCNKPMGYVAHAYQEILEERQPVAYCSDACVRAQARKNAHA